MLSILLSSGDEPTLEISPVKAQHGGVDAGDAAVSSESESGMVSEQRRDGIVEVPRESGERPFWCLIKMG